MVSAPTRHPRIVALLRNACLDAYPKGTPHVHGTDGDGARRRSGVSKEEPPVLARYDVNVMAVDGERGVFDAEIADQIDGMHIERNDAFDDGHCRCAPAGGRTAKRMAAAGVENVAGDRRATLVYQTRRHPIVIARAESVGVRRVGKTADHFISAQVERPVRLDGNGPGSMELRRSGVANQAYLDHSGESFASIVVDPDIDAIHTFVDQSDRHRRPGVGESAEGSLRPSVAIDESPSGAPPKVSKEPRERTGTG